MYSKYTRQIDIASVIIMDRPVKENTFGDGRREKRVVAKKEVEMVVLFINFFSIKNIGAPVRVYQLSKAITIKKVPCRSRYHTDVCSKEGNKNCSFVRSCFER